MNETHNSVDGSYALSQQDLEEVRRLKLITPNEAQIMSRVAASREVCMHTSPRGCM